MSSSFGKTPLPRHHAIKYVPPKNWLRKKFLPCWAQDPLWSAGRWQVWICCAHPNWAVVSFETSLHHHHFHHHHHHHFRHHHDDHRYHHYHHPHHHDEQRWEKERQEGSSGGVPTGVIESLRFWWRWMCWGWICENEGDENNDERGHGKPCQALVRQGPLSVRLNEGKGDNAAVMMSMKVYENKNRWNISSDSNSARNQSYFHVCFLVILFLKLYFKGKLRLPTMAFLRLNASVLASKYVCCVTKRFQIDTSFFTPKETCWWSHGCF